MMTRSPARGWLLLLLSMVLSSANPSMADEQPPDEAPRLFATVRADPPITQPDRYRESHTITLALETLHAPVERITLNLPGREPEIVTRLHWEPRQGYIQIPDPDDPTGFGSITIPDPSARPEDFRWRWYGRSANFTVGLTVEAGVVAGRVTGRVHRYAIEPRGNGRITLGLSNGDFWQTHAGDRERERAQRSGVEVLTDRPAPTVAAARTVAGTDPRGEKPVWDEQCTGPLPEGTHVIDVLQLYTEGLLDRYDDDLAALRPVLRESLDDANQALRNSGVSNVVFAPRGPEPLPNETGTDPFDFDTEAILVVLDRVAGVTRNPTPPHMTFNESAYVPTRRNAMWADVVAVARDGTMELGLPPGFFTCGIGYLNNVVRNNGFLTEPGGPDAFRFGYLVYDPGCGADRLNLAHELGHLLGMDHDPANPADQVRPGIYPSCPWSWGHRRSDADPRFRFRTVMAYPTPGTPGTPGFMHPHCDHPDNCPQIDAYETPLLEWAGVPGSGGSPPFGLQPVGTVAGAQSIGVPVPSAPFARPSNGVDTISRIAPTVAAYRPRPDDNLCPWLRISLSPPSRCARCSHGAASRRR